VDCRPGDQVLLTWPENWNEPLLVGVLAGPRPCVDISEPMEKTVTFVHGERLTVCSPGGKELFAVEGAEDGSHRLRLSGRLSTWEFEDTLRIVAPCIDLCSTRGDVSVTASEEVIIKGTIIRLN
jgi:hypothetical protein